MTIAEKRRVLGENETQYTSRKGIYRAARTHRSTGQAVADSPPGRARRWRDRGLLSLRQQLERCEFPSKGAPPHFETSSEGRQKCLSVDKRERVRATHSPDLRCSK